MLDLLREPWPWYVAGPLIGITMPVLLLVGNKLLGVSSNLRHIGAACGPKRLGYFRYDWKRRGLWNLAFAVGILLGGFLAGVVFANPDPIAISAATRADLAALGVTDFSGLVPDGLFAWEALLSVRGFIMLGVGGFLTGFGTAYGGGCTSGHGISGLADRQMPSLVATASFFTGGILVTHFVLPVLLGGAG